MPIEATVDGPYRVEGSPILRNSRDALDAGDPVFLCRCGGSGNKPFCDGTHQKNGFSSRREHDEPPTRDTDAYEGKDITILDNRTVCAHAGECTGGLPAVWKLGEEPWIDGEGADAEAIRNTIRNCPSGALAWVGGEAHSDRDPEIVVSKDGPYHVRGTIPLADPTNGQSPQSAEHYTLCRCGGSKNKPFCDGTHWHIGFADPKN